MANDKQLAATITQIVEARMKETEKRLAEMIEKSMANAFSVESMEELMARNNEALGELLVGSLSPQWGPTVHPQYALAGDATPTPEPNVDINPPALADVKPIILSDAQRQQLETILGGVMLNNGDDVVKYVARLCRVSLTTLDGLQRAYVDISMDTLERLDSRRPIDTTLQEMVQTEISDFLQRFIDGER